MRVILWLAVVAMLYLTFAWPFAHSSDPADPWFKIAAISVFAFFFVSLVAILACRVRRTSS